MQLAHIAEERGEIVVVLLVDAAFLVGTSIPAVTTVGTVEPHLEQLTVVGEQLTQLFLIVIDIGGGGIGGLMTVPGREIDAELESMAAACLSQLAHHIALAILVGTVLDAIIGVFGGPQTEAIVVFSRQDDAFHATGFQSLHPLVDIAIAQRGVENIDRIVAIAPLHAVVTTVGVGTVMDEGIGLHALPRHLMGGGHGEHGLGWTDLGAEGRRQQEGAEDEDGVKAMVHGWKGVKGLR